MRSYQLFFLRNTQSIKATLCNGCISLYETDIEKAVSYCSKSCKLLGKYSDISDTLKKGLKP